MAVSPAGFEPILRAAHSVSGVMEAISIELRDHQDRYNAPGCGHPQPDRLWHGASAGAAPSDRRQHHAGAHANPALVRHVGTKTYRGGAAAFALSTVAPTGARPCRTRLQIWTGNTLHVMRGPRRLAVYCKSITLCHWCPACTACHPSHGRRREVWCPRYCIAPHTHIAARAEIVCSHSAFYKRQCIGAIV